MPFIFRRLKINSTANIRIFEYRLDFEQIYFKTISMTVSFKMSFIIRRLKINSTVKICIFEYKLDRKSYYKTLCTVCITLISILSLTSTHIIEYEVVKKYFQSIFEN